MKARVFDIQRASFVDGPGIRTTIFFQGCNLRCKWCHNPESWRMQPQLMFYDNRCAHCGSCAEFCPFDAIASDGTPDRKRCLACGKCVLYCPHDARCLCGKEMETVELLKMVLRDRSYYNQSGGGMTVSGGECMLQIDALSELLELARRENISTAVDTAGNVPWSFFERILPLTDWFLYDLKCLTPKLHENLTGSDNCQILHNYLRMQSQYAEKLIVRVPVIPDCNDIGDELEQLAEWIRLHPPAKTEFLPYHRLGENKSAAIGQEIFHCEVPSDERIRYLKSICDKM